MDFAFVDRVIEISNFDHVMKDYAQAVQTCWPGALHTDNNVPEQPPTTRQTVVRIITRCNSRSAPMGMGEQVAHVRRYQERLSTYFDGLIPADYACVVFYACCLSEDAAGWLLPPDIDPVFAMKRSIDEMFNMKYRRVWSGQIVEITPEETLEIWSREVTQVLGLMPGADGLESWSMRVLLHASVPGEEYSWFRFPRPARALA